MGKSIPRQLEQVWVGDQLFQYDANRTYPNTNRKLVDIRVKSLSLSGLSVRDAIFVPAGFSKVGTADYLISSNNRVLSTFSPLAGHL